MLEEATYWPEVIASDGEGCPPGARGAVFDLPGVARELLKEARIIALAAGGGLALAAVACLFWPPQFTSTASFLPPGGNTSSGAAALAGQLSQLPGMAGGMLGGMKSAGDLYVGILKSRSVADELIDRTDLLRVYGVKKKSDAEETLASRSSFDAGLKDGIVTISVSDRSPDRARDLANQYLDALREINGRMALSESSQRRVFFSQQLAREKDELENAEVALKQTEEQSGLVAPAGQTAAEIQAVAQTRAQIAAREVELAALRTSATDENPEVVRLQSAIANLRGQLVRLASGGGRSDATDIPVSKVPRIELDYVRKEREVKYHEALFGILARQYEAARIDEAHDAPLLQVLDPASHPDSRSSPRRLLILLGGATLGLATGSAWVLFRGGIQAFCCGLMPGKWPTGAAKGS